jgi:hypothetical protein
MVKQGEPTDPHIDGYRRGASSVYASLLHARFAADRMAADYGKWIFQSLLLLHCGAIVGAFAYMSSVPSQRLQISQAIPCFVAGIVVILLAGFMAWVNWSAIADAFRQQADPWMVEDRSRYPKGLPPRTRLVSASLWASVAFGFISGLFLLFGAAVAYFAVRSAT